MTCYMEQLKLLQLYYNSKFMQRSQKWLMPVNPKMSKVLWKYYLKDWMNELATVESSHDGMNQWGNRETKSASTCLNGVTTWRTCHCQYLTHAELQENLSIKVYFFPQGWNWLIGEQEVNMKHSPVWTELYPFEGGSSFTWSLYS